MRNESSSRPRSVYTCIRKGVRETSCKYATFAMRPVKVSHMRRIATKRSCPTLDLAAAGTRKYDAERPVISQDRMILRGGGLVIRLRQSLNDGLSVSLGSNGEGYRQVSRPEPRAYVRVVSGAFGLRNAECCSMAAFGRPEEAKASVCRRPAGAHPKTWGKYGAVGISGRARNL